MPSLSSGRTRPNQQSPDIGTDRQRGWGGYVTAGLRRGHVSPVSGDLVCFSSATRSAWHVPRADARVRPMAAFLLETPTQDLPSLPGDRCVLLSLPHPPRSTCSPSLLDHTSVFARQDEGHALKSRLCKNSHKQVTLTWLESPLGARKALAMTSASWPTGEDSSLLLPVFFLNQLHLKHQISADC